VEKERVVTMSIMRSYLDVAALELLPHALLLRRESILLGIKPLDLRRSK
jgi:hypothetical protein